jgi:hypothetical protein
MSRRVHAYAALVFACWLVGACSSPTANGDGGDGCDAYRRYACSTSPNGLCDINGNPAQPLTAAQMEYIQSHCTGQD